jgi:hypothetical protein
MKCVYTVIRSEKVAEQNGNLKVTDFAATTQLTNIKEFEAEGAGLLVVRAFFADILRRCRIRLVELLHIWVNCMLRHDSSGGPLA